MADPAPAAPSVTIDDVRAAADRIGPFVHRTPVLTSKTIDELAGSKVVMKAENLQVGGAFKARGATNAIAKLADGPTPPRGVVAPSSGNHAQAVAIAARRFGLPATILMPEDAPRLKVEATIGYGAEVVRYDRYREDRDSRVAALTEDPGLAIVPPYDHPDVIAGQGTVALELAEAVEDLDAVIVPVGGGGLISGIAVAMAAVRPSCRVIGIEPEAGDDARRSMAEGAIVEIPTPRTIADGQQAPIGRITVPLIQRHVEAIELVSDDEIVEAMRLLFERSKLVVEPSGACALAGLLRHGEALGLQGRTVGVVLSGGNIGAEEFAGLMAGS
jgi:threonine dehydratase